MSATRKVYFTYIAEIPLPELLTVLGIVEPVELRDIVYGDSDEGDTVRFVLEAAHKPA